jgi:hypothetical protein
VRCMDIRAERFQIMWSGLGTPFFVPGFRNMGNQPLYYLHRIQCQPHITNFFRLTPPLTTCLGAIIELKNAKETRDCTISRSRRSLLTFPALKRSIGYAHWTLVHIRLATQKLTRVECPLTTIQPMHTAYTLREHLRNHATTCVNILSMLALGNLQHFSCVHEDCMNLPHLQPCVFQS